MQTKRPSGCILLKALRRCDEKKDSSRRGTGGTNTKGLLPIGSNSYKKGIALAYESLWHIKNCWGPLIHSSKKWHPQTKLCLCIWFTSTIYMPTFIRTIPQDEFVWKHLDGCPLAIKRGNGKSPIHDGQQEWFKHQLPSLSRSWGLYAAKRRPFALSNLGNIGKEW